MSTWRVSESGLGFFQIKPDTEWGTFAPVYHVLPTIRNTTFGPIMDLVSKEI